MWPAARGVGRERNPRLTPRAKQLNLRVLPIVFLLMRIRLFPPLLLTVLLSFVLWRATAGAAEAPKPPGGLTLERDITPLLDKYCYACHGRGKSKGDLALDSFHNLAEITKERKVWELVLHHVHSGEMPPDNKPQPTPAERERITGWLEATLFHFDPKHPDPGRVTIRRLNRAEYNNTVHDLLGVDFHPADDFPVDDSGYGFDTIGDVLSLPPLLMEKYLAAADKVLESALPSEQGVIKGAVPPPLPEALQRIFTRQPTPGTKSVAAREIIGQLARRAWRRPVTDRELDRLVRLFELADTQGDDFRASLKLAFKAVLVSPHFIFRGELQPQPDNPDAIQPVDEFALAARLSYFLWSSMPDDELLDLAGRGALRKNLTGQVQRMLASPKSSALTANFAGQWLQTRSLGAFTPDRTLFPDFDEPLRAAMTEETARYFEAVMREDRSVMDFLNGDYTFVNDRLARYYGLTNVVVTGGGFQRVSLVGLPRRGVLTQGSVLLLTSNATRTSLVKRGKWVLENLLGSPPPAPPPNVPPLKNDGQPLTGPLRQQMEQHRADPICASCHARMDPIGFGLENFNAIGAWRVKEGGFAIDPAGKLTTGEDFAGAVDLINLLARKKRTDFLRCISGKMLTYALGRGLEYYDRPVVDGLVKNLEAHHDRFSTLILGVVNSVPFQMRRGEGEPGVKLASQAIGTSSSPRD